jgi:hypothetical protein
MPELTNAYMDLTATSDRMADRLRAQQAMAGLPAFINLPVIVSFTAAFWIIAASLHNRTLPRRS